MNSELLAALAEEKSSRTLRQRSILHALLQEENRIDIALISRPPARLIAGFSRSKGTSPKSRNHQPL